MTDAIEDKSPAKKPKKKKHHGAADGVVVSGSWDHSWSIDKAIVKKTSRWDALADKEKDGKAAAKPKKGARKSMGGTAGEATFKETLAHASTKKRKDRTPATVVAARDIMLKSEFFMAFDKAMPGLITSLAKIAQVQKSKKGDVIFRQGDPPVDWYSIMSGTIGVHVEPGYWRGKQMSPRELEPPAPPKLTAEEKEAAANKDKTKVKKDRSIRGIWKRFVVFCCTRRSKEKHRAQPVVLKVEPVREKRWLTTEGHNTFSAKTDFGPLVVSLGRGVEFGELALLESNPRAATITCLEKCKFLVVQQSDFLHMFGGSIAKQKIAFFVEHVPGFQVWAGTHKLKTHKEYSGRLVATMEYHPCDGFERVEVKKGTVFLGEGEIAEPQIIILAEGDIEFWKRSFDLPRMSPAKLGSSGIHNIGFQLHVAAAPPVLKPLKAVQLTNKIWHRLGGKGAIFCSLGVFNVPCAESFSVIAQSDCVVYVCRGKDVFLLPEDIKIAIKKQITETLKPLLWQSAGFESCACLQLPNIKSVLAEIERMEEIDDSILV